MHLYDPLESKLEAGELVLRLDLRTWGLLLYIQIQLLCVPHPADVLGR